MKPKRLFDGESLRAELFNGSAQRLFVSFRQRVGDPGSFSDATPVRNFTGHGFAHLYLQSKRNDWYINSETEALESVLGAHCTRYSDAVAMGFSMGGYAALRFARVLGLSNVVLVSPQVSIHPKVVPWDRRYRDCAGGFDRTLGDLAIHGAVGLRGLMLFDPFRPKDWRNSDAISDLFPGIQPCRLAGGGHPATQILRAADGFKVLQSGLRDGELVRRDILDLHREARAGEATYWRRLAKVAERHNKPILAKEASARAVASNPLSKG
jgi:pimeloyl-ACP methyl ester carboxylesterase